MDIVRMHRNIHLKSYRLLFKGNYAWIVEIFTKFLWLCDVTEKWQNNRLKRYHLILKRLHMLPISIINY